MDNNTQILKSDLLLLLLYSKGRSNKHNEPIRGITRFMKLLYLLDVEGKFDKNFYFEPYKMGPFSSEVYPELEFLKSYPTPERPLIETKKDRGGSNLFTQEQIKIIEDISLEGEDEPLSYSEINTEFSLSDLGEKVACKLWDQLKNDQKTTIESIKTKYGGIPLRSLLKYVYKNYPEMTTNSEIKDQVL